MKKAKTRTETINDYIVEHYGRVSNSTIEKVFNISELSVKLRIARLKTKKLIKKSTKPFLKVNKEIKEVIKKDNTFSNSEGVKKQEARELILNACKLQGKILSLPFSTCEIEKQILAKNSEGFKFIGCEYHLETYQEMLKTIANDEVLANAIEPRFAKTSDVTSTAKEDEYSNLILDYCGVLDLNAEEIENVVKNNIVKVGGAICITLNKRGYQGDSIKDRIKASFPKDMYGTSIGDIELTTMLHFTNLVGNNRGYSIEEFFPYQDEQKDENGKPVYTDKGRKVLKAPMMLIVIRRNK